MNLPHCEEVRRRMEALIDHEIGGPERVVLRAHLDTCHACASEYRRIECLVDLLARTPPEAAPEGFLQGVTGRLASRPLTGRRVGTHRRLALAAGLLLLAAGGAWVLADGAASPDGTRAQRWPGNPALVDAGPPTGASEESLRSGPAAFEREPWPELDPEPGDAPALDASFDGESSRGDNAVPTSPRVGPGASVSAE